MRTVILSPEDYRGGICYYAKKVGHVMNVEVCSYNLTNVKGKNLVHVQFEYNVWEFRPFGLTFVPYLIILRLMGRKVIVTLHSVYSIRNFERAIMTSYYQGSLFLICIARLYIYFLTKIICSLTHATIVLNRRARQILKDEYGIKNVFHVEFCSYGLREKEIVPREEAKAKLGFSDKIVLFSFGVLRFAKRYELVISLLPMLRTRYPNILYMITENLPPTDPGKGRKYLEWLSRLSRRLDVDENIIFVDYIHEDELKNYFGASNVVIFPHRDGAYGSAASKHAMSYLATMICSDVSCFESFENGVHCLKFSSKEDLFQKILRVIENEPNFKDGLRKKIEELSIENHARKHLDIYERVLSGRIKTGKIRRMC